MIHDQWQMFFISRDLKPFVCEICGASFKGVGGYKFHMTGKNMIVNRSVT